MDETWIHFKGKGLRLFPWFYISLNLLLYLYIHLSYSDYSRFLSGPHLHAFEANYAWLYSNRDRLTWSIGSEESRDSSIWKRDEAQGYLSYSRVVIGFSFNSFVPTPAGLQLPSPFLSENLWFWSYTSNIGNKTIQLDSVSIHMYDYVITIYF
jgi:hypothetical protein